LSQPGREKVAAGRAPPPPVHPPAVAAGPVPGDAQATACRYRGAST
jgi:hypothetical protein